MNPSPADGPDGSSGNIIQIPVCLNKKHIHENVILHNLVKHTFIHDIQCIENSARDICAIFIRFRENYASQNLIKDKILKKHDF